MKSVYLPNASRWLRMMVWIAQGVVASVFLGVGLIELTYSPALMIEYLPWVDAHPLWFTRILGVVDLLGATGILVPALINRLPRVVKLAAAGCAAKQVVAISFHATLGVAAVIPLNILLLASSLLVLKYYSGLKLR